MSSRHSNFSSADTNDDDDEWLFESIVAYLSSPIWAIPIQHYMEQHCMVFSPSDGWSGSALLETDEEEIDMKKVPADYLKIHSKYKELVDVLINTFLQDLGVSYNKFLRACKNSSHFNKHPIYMELFEQIWAAEDFKMFKSQMIKKNIELELQALILLQAQLGLVKSMTGTVDGDQKHDDEIMNIVIRKSKDEYDALLNGRLRTSNTSNQTAIQRPQDLEIAKRILKSEEITENLKNELEQQDYLNRKIIKDVVNGTSQLSDNQLQFRPNSARKIANKSNNEIDEQTAYNLDKLTLRDNSKRSVSNMKIRQEDDDDDDIQTSHSAAAYSSTSSSSDHDQIVNNLAMNYLQQTGVNSESELARRAEFMQKQREILNEKKLAERKKQLDQFMRQSEQNDGPKRPMSSRAARSVLTGTDPNQIPQASLSSSSRTPTDDERKKMEARKMLAETLRKEVINNNKK